MMKKGEELSFMNLILNEIEEQENEDEEIRGNIPKDDESRKITDAVAQTYRCHARTVRQMQVMLTRAIRAFREAANLMKRRPSVRLMLDEPLE